MVLSCTQDDFFARNRFSNFGDLGVAVKGLMDDYQKATRLNENINSIEDMQAFLERQVVYISSFFFYASALAFLQSWPISFRKLSCACSYHDSLSHVTIRKGQVPTRIVIEIHLVVVSRVESMQGIISQGTDAAGDKYTEVSNNALAVRMMFRLGSKLKNIK